MVKLPLFVTYIFNILCYANCPIIVFIALTEMASLRKRIADRERHIQEIFEITSPQTLFYTLNLLSIHGLRFSWFLRYSYSLFTLGNPA